MSAKETRSWSATLTKRITSVANTTTQYSNGSGCMAVKQSSKDTPEQAARRRILAENCNGIFGKLTNEEVHEIFVNDAPSPPSLQAVEALRRTDEAPHSKSKTVTSLATILKCEEDDLFTQDLWKKRKSWLSSDGHFLSVPKSGSVAVDVARKETKPVGIESPAAQNLKTMTPLFQKAMHSKPSEVVETCEEIASSEYRHLFAYFVYWMQDQAKHG